MGAALHRRTQRSNPMRGHACRLLPSLSHSPCVRACVVWRLRALRQAMQKMSALMGGAGGGDEDDLLGGLGLGDDDEGASGDDLKARVREQMAQMMNKRRGAAAMDEDEF